MAIAHSSPRQCIVGNSPSLLACGQEIDSFDQVVRFNNTSGFGNRSGSNITELVLVSRGGQAREWLEDRSFTARSAVKAARSVTLVFPPTDDPGAECCFDELRSLLSGEGKEVSHISQDVHRHARETLDKLGAAGDAALSSGFLYTFQRLHHTNHDGSRLHVYGFSFEGWNGHAWDAEKAWFIRQMREGLIELHFLEKGNTL